MSGRAPIVEFRSDDDDETLLLLSYHAADPDMGALEVEVRSSGLTCTESALSLGGDGLDVFLAGLAADWRGWEGVRRWDTLEMEIGLEATHQGHRVKLLFIVRRDYEQDSWELRLPILVAPGESLSRLAVGTAGLFGR